ncbi:MAG: sulfotransferase [Bacteroidota bacterium]
MISRIIHKAAETKHDLSIALRKARYDSKVFCIGYNKTGTTSLGKSLEILGYRNSSFNKKVWRKYYKEGHLDKVLAYTAKFDSVDDLPWLLEDMIPLLDETFPQSKFIYLERDEESWKKSYYNWHHKLTDQYPDIDKALQKFQAHKDFVFEYFKDRPSQDFIVLNIREKGGFKKLADFLGKPTDQLDFPHYNKT